MIKSGRKLGLAVLVTSMLVGAGVAVASGKLITWDLRNYHYYGAHVLWTGRWGVDFNPGFFQSHVNPIFYLPFYLLVRSLPDHVVGGLLGALQGGSFWLLWGIARLCLAGLYPGVSRAGLEGLALLSALLGVAGPLFVSLLGSASPDLFSGLLVCGGLWALLAAPPGRDGRWHCAGAALLFGLAVGAKLTNSVFAVAFAATFLVWRARQEGFAGTLAAVTLAGAAGVLVSGGPWMWQLWVHYESPLFPFYNAIFQSPFTGPENFQDMRWVPDRYWRAFVSYPFELLMASKRTLETPLRDPRWAILAVGALAWALCKATALLRSLPTARPGPPRHATWMLFTFAGLSYAIWLKMFGYQRYLLPVELLAGTCMVALVGLLWRDPLLRVGALTLVCAAVFSLTQPPRHWPRIPWTGSWLEVEVPNLEQERGAVVAILTAGPAGYVVPFFPEEVRFARVLVRRFEGYRLWRQMDELLRHPPGALFALVEPGKPLRRRDRRYLDEVGIEIDDTRCQPVVTQVERFDLCETRRRVDEEPGSMRPRGRSTARNSNSAGRPAAARELLSRPPSQAP